MLEKNVLEVHDGEEHQGFEGNAEGDERAGVRGGVRRHAGELHEHQGPVPLGAGPGPGGGDHRRAGPRI